MNPFLWLSGADPAIIDSCGKLSQSERNKFIGFGTTVVIPAIIAGIAGGYAVSTFKDSPFIYIPFGILWFFIILAIDRFLVSTLYKSNLSTKFAFASALVIRLILSIVLGIVISHPLVLFIFNDSITQKINKDHRTEYRAEAGQVESSVNDRIKSDVALREEKEDEIQCVMTLQSYEATGNHKVAMSPKGKPCGQASDKATCGYKCEKIYGKRIEVLQAKIKEINDRITADKATFSEQVKKVESAYSKPPASDYLNRTEALEKMAATSSHIWWAEKLLIVALVLIDSLLVILKASTPRGAYEIEKDKLVQRVDILSNSENEAIKNHAATAHREVVELQLKAQSVADTIEAIREVPEKFVTDEHDRMMRYEQQVKKLGKSRFMDMQQLREMYLDVYKRSAAIISKFLKP